jgi:hypothetical protein
LQGSAAILAAASIAAAFVLNTFAWRLPKAYTIGFEVDLQSMARSRATGRARIGSDRRMGEDRARQAADFWRFP